MGCLGSRADGRLWLILLLGLCAEHVFSSPNNQRSRETAGNVGVDDNIMSLYRHSAPKSEVANAAPPAQPESEAAKSTHQEGESPAPRESVEKAVASPPGIPSKRKRSGGHGSMEDFRSKRSTLSSQELMTLLALLNERRNRMNGPRYDDDDSSEEMDGPPPPPEYFYDRPEDDDDSDEDSREPERWEETYSRRRRVDPRMYRYPLRRSGVPVFLDYGENKRTLLKRSFGKRALRKRTFGKRSFYGTPRMGPDMAEYYDSGEPGDSGESGEDDGGPYGPDFRPYVEGENGPSSEEQDDSGEDENADSGSQEHDQGPPRPSAFRERSIKEEEWRRRKRIIPVPQIYKKKRMALKKRGPNFGWD